MIIKPMDSINIIGKEIMESVDSFSLHLKKNQRIEYSSIIDAIYYVESGSISIFRLSDSVLTINMEYPALTGLTQLRNEYRYHYLRCDEDSIIWGIEKNKAEKLFNEKILWKYAFDILAYISNLYHARELMMTKKNVNEIVLQHLNFIWEMPKEERNRTSIYSFILSRNHISRSAIHKAINELVESDCITVSKGKLLTMNAMYPLSKL